MSWKRTRIGPPDIKGAYRERHSVTGDTRWLVRVYGQCPRTGRHYRNAIERLPLCASDHECFDVARRITRDLGNGFFERGAYGRLGVELTLAEFVDQHLKRLASTGRSESTMVDWRYGLAPLLEAHGHQRIAEVTYRDITSPTGWLELVSQRDVNAKTLAGWRTKAIAVFDAATNQDLRRDANPFRAVILRRAAPPKERRHLELAELVPFFARMRADDEAARSRRFPRAEYMGHYPALATMYLTWCRPGELLSAELADIDWKTGDWTVRGARQLDGARQTKTRMTRVVPLPADVLAMLCNHVTQTCVSGPYAGKPEGARVYLFPSRTGGVSESGARFRKRVPAAREALGLPSWFVPHRLRSLGSVEALRLTTERVVDKVGGWSGRSARQRHYDAAATEEMRSVIAARSRAFFAAMAAHEED